jgi:energy-coupling factor transporter ATP-binding protein EcfA2
MALTSLELRQFTVFENAELELCPGINVLIGKNSTGKSHAMKAAYALLQGLSRAANENAGEARRDTLVSERLTRIFLPDRLDRLIRRPSVESERGAELLLSMDGTDVVVTLKGDIAKVSPQPVEPPPSLFVTSRDVLAFSEGFVRLYEKRELSFDETYADLSRALEVSPLRQPPELLGRIESILGGKVRREGDRFYVKQGGEEFEAHLVGEGLRKIATLVHLIANGSLTKGSILFWDEPEAGLNPQMIADMADFIRALAAWGVQILIATHDYLLPSRLSVAVSSRLQPEVATRFFSLHRAGVNEPVEVEWGDTLEELEHNPILQAHAQFYDYKSESFSRTGFDS